MKPRSTGSCNHSPGSRPARLPRSLLLCAVLCTLLSPSALQADTLAGLPARVDQVQSDPFFDAWVQALESRDNISKAAGQQDAHGSYCGAEDALREATHRAHLARRQLLASLEQRGFRPTPPPAGVAPWPWSPSAGIQSTLEHYDKDNVSVLVDDGRMVFINLRANPEVDGAFAAQAFYENHEDEYEFVALFTTFFSDLFEGQFRAYHLAVENTVRGLGYQNTNLGDEFSERRLYVNGDGIGGTLESFLHLNDINLYPDNPDDHFLRSYSAAAFMMHEVSHRWSMRLRVWLPLFGPQPVLLGRSNVHWGFFANAGGSFNEGVHWVPDGDGWVTAAATSTFGQLDLYLMGLLAPHEIDESELFFFDRIDTIEPATDAFDNPWNAWSPPQVGVSVRGNRVPFDMDSIFLANSIRRPLPQDAPDTFKAATLLVIPASGSPNIDAEIAKINVYQQRLMDLFHSETQQRGTLDLSVRSVPAALELLHLPQGNIELENTAVEVAVNIGMTQRSLPTTLDDIDATLHYQVNGGAIMTLPMQRGAGSIYRASIPGQLTGTRVDYWVTAGSDFPGHQYALPSDAPTSTLSYEVAPDTGAPTIQHAAVPNHPRAAEPLLIRAWIRDTHRIASADIEYRPASGGNWVRQPLQRQGVSDIFEARVIFPGRPGDDIEYRIVASDAAQTPHVATLPSTGSYTLRITDTLFHDVERDDPMWTHRSLKRGAVDQWHREPINFTSGGTYSWKLGPERVSNFARVGFMALDMDAALETPAMRLGPGWSMEFFQRYYLRLSPPDTDLTAVDGALIEWQNIENTDDVLADRWYAIAPVGGYPKRLANYSFYNPLKGRHVWAGQRDYWEHVTLRESGTHLTLTHGMIRFRFRCATTPIIWYDRPSAGWYVDDITIDPGAVTTAISIEDLRAHRAPEGVQLQWRAEDVVAGESFSIDRAATGSDDWQRLTRIAGTVGVRDYNYTDDSAPLDADVHYRITLWRDGQEIAAQVVQVQAVPLRFHLAQNTPNPFNPQTRIDFELPQSGRATLSIFDVRGRLVRTLVSEELTAGSHSRTWNGTDDQGARVASGVYLYHLSTRTHTATHRMLLLQ